MIVIYGTRHAGAVDHHEGQHAITRFAHVYYLPLFPIGGRWMTGSQLGHESRLSGRSVLAGYGRVWGPLIGVGLACFGGVAIVAGIAIAGSGLATFAWYGLRTASARRQSDLNLACFGTRCDPKLMPRELVITLRPLVEERWAAESNGESPSDVARFGTDDPARAAAAYAVLRLAALDMPARERAEAEADAARIVDQIRELPEATGGPYRSAT